MRIDQKVILRKPLNILGLQLMECAVFHFYSHVGGSLNINTFCREENKTAEPTLVRISLITSHNFDMFQACSSL